MACDSPISIRFNPPKPDGAGGLIYWFPADCGKCLKCLVKKKAQWSYRLWNEKINSIDAHFITLTYDDDHVPVGNGVLSLSKQDHFDYIKSLKKLRSEPLKLKKTLSYNEFTRYSQKIGEYAKDFKREDYPLKYLAVGEYGDRLKRPHMHYIIFNIFDEEKLKRAWNKGIVHLDECNQNTIDYVVKYMLKDHSNEEYQHKEKEFRCMSKGLGKNVSQEFIAYINSPEGNQVVNSRGGSVGLPRYYNKLYVTEENLAKKHLYIKSEVEKEAEKYDATCYKFGLNPDKKRLEGKEARVTNLKNRSKRLMQ